MIAGGKWFALCLHHFVLHPLSTDKLDACDITNFQRMHLSDCLSQPKAVIVISMKIWMVSIHCQWMNQPNHLVPRKLIHYPSHDYYSPRVKDAMNKNDTVYEDDIYQTCVEQVVHASKYETGYCVHYVI
ncbi:hypothetical protein B0O80DRAFT_431746 [Mortierella sp. GBAus27b]|nr:hypothetical protein B0O80DRAFT_431746 [Mortierella sp. GBAus27b]